jgi:8-oxo-dGTP pyrophosphatase MutT (NUDIX family)
MSDRPSRDFTVAVFVVCQGMVVLHRHRKLGLWLPPGGHIEQDELPDEAALREVTEEAGIAIELVGDRGLDSDYPGQPVQLVRPEGIQLEQIGPDHQHIDLIYFAMPVGAGVSLPALSGGMRWIGAEDLDGIELTDEVRDWCLKAIAVWERW